jgi:glycosyltransferase involved in cell wall biosynthesis
MNKLTVIMPVYNGERFLKESIDSVLSQTFTDFQLIIIDDGSKDNSLSIIDPFIKNDSRVILIENNVNLGVAKTRNMGLDIVQTQYLAWMDCDDILHKDRFKEQVAYLDKNPHVSICGSWMKRFEHGKEEICKSPLKHGEIAGLLLFKPAIWNATTMFRTFDIKNNGLKFNDSLPIAEDYDFYLRASFTLKLANIPKPLYFYRRTKGSITHQYESNEHQHLFQIHKKIYPKLFMLFNLPVNNTNLYLHFKIGSDLLINNYNEYIIIFNWLNSILKNSKGIKEYNNKEFYDALAFVWFFVSKKSSQIGVKTFIFYIKNANKFGYVNIYGILKLFIRCLIKYNKF